MLKAVLAIIGTLFKGIRAWLDESLPFRRPRARLRGWRRTRPFWGGAWVIAGGATIVIIPLAPLPIMITVGVAAISGVAIGIVLVMAGLFLWFAPQQRMFVAAVSAICALISFVTSNLGGLGFGMLFALLGSSMAFGWRPHAQSKQARRLAARSRAKAMRLNPLPSPAPEPAPHPDSPPAAAPARGAPQDSPVQGGLAVIVPIGLALAVLAAVAPQQAYAQRATSPLPSPPSTAALTPAPSTTILLPSLSVPSPTSASEPAAPAPVPSPSMPAVPPTQTTAPPKVRAADNDKEAPVSPYPAVVSADKLDAEGFSLKGTRFLDTARGPLKVLVFHADRLVAKNYQLRSVEPASPVLSIGVDLDISDVEIYATRLSGTVTIPMLGIPLISIILTPELIPAWLPVYVWLPVFSGVDIAAEQALIKAATVQAKNVRVRVAAN